MLLLPAVRHAGNMHRLSCGACAHAQIVGRVAGVLKMTGKDEAQKNKPLRGETGTGAEVTATLEFAPPVHVRWARFNAAGRTTFISAFYASPAGARTLMGPCTRAWQVLEVLGVFRFVHRCNIRAF